MPVPKRPFDRERLIVARATFGATPEIEDDLDRLGLEGWLDQQLHPDAIDDRAAERVTDDAVDKTAYGSADIRMLARALYSRRQLAWRMVHFLNNHLATYRGKTTPISEANEDDAFYSRCFSNYYEVLRTSATSPAMIDFLDSRSNLAGNPNENYARELLELHTIGVDGGYTEADVQEVARVFTGWSRTNVGSNPVTDSYFTFRPSDHDAGPKAISIGWSTPGIAGPEGDREGLGLLRFLAKTNRAAAFFTAKLCRYFLADTPPPDLLNRVQHVFVATGGNLRETVRAMLLDQQFATPTRADDKVHDGFEFAVRILRRAHKAPLSLANVDAEIGGMRAQPHAFPVPTGYPEIGAAWQGPGHVLPRWRFVDDWAHDRINGTPVPWQDIFEHVPDDGAKCVDGLTTWLGHELAPAIRFSLIVFMNGRLAPLGQQPTWNEVRPHAADCLALILKLPSMQVH